MILSKIIPRVVVQGAPGRKKIIDGVNILANAVKVTLGPKGRNVVMYDIYTNLNASKILYLLHHH